VFSCRVLSFFLLIKQAKEYLMDYIITIVVIFLLYQFVEYTNRPKRTRKKYYQSSNEPIFGGFNKPTETTKPVEPEPEPKQTYTIPTELRWSDQFMSPEQKAEHLLSDFWYDLRSQRMVIANNQCEVPGCGSTHRLNCHHTHYLTLGNESVEDLRIVCRSCHQKIHDKLGCDRVTKYPIECLK